MVVAHPVRVLSCLQSPVKFSAHLGSLLIRIVQLQTNTQLNTIVFCFHNCNGKVTDTAVSMKRTEKAFGFTQHGKTVYARH